MPHNTNGQKWIRNEKRCAIYARDEFRCVYCLASPSKLVLDHVEPHAGNEADNLVTSCLPCNMRKGDRSCSAWLLRREALGEERGQIALVRQRVAIATFLPPDLELGRRLERQRRRGPGSFQKLARLRLHVAA